MQSKRTFRSAFLILGGLTITLYLSFFLAIQPGRATELVENDNIPAGVTVDDDVIMQGEVIIIDGNVDGNLFVNSTHLILNGRVEGSVVAIGQSLTVNGAIRGSLFAAGGYIVISDGAEIGGNVYGVSASLELQPGAVVQRGISYSGYQAIIAGNVLRTANFGVGAVEINGTIGADLNIELGDNTGDAPVFLTSFGLNRVLSPGLSVGKSAAIAGQLSYRSPNDYSDQILAVPVGGVVREMPVASVTEVDANREWFSARIQNILNLLLLGLFWLWIVPGQASVLAPELVKMPVKSFFVGMFSTFAGYLGAGVVAFLLLLLVILFGTVSISGVSSTLLWVGYAVLWLGVTLLTFLVIYGGRLVSVYALGRLLGDRYLSGWITDRYRAFGLGLLIYALLRFIPGLGGVIDVVAASAGIGIVAYRSWGQVRSPVKSQAAIAAAEVSINAEVEQ